MGQARQRGTKDERVYRATTVSEERRRKAERAEMEHNLEVARQWAAKTPEEREAALEAAKREAENYGYLSSVFGHDAALMLSMIGRK